MEDFIQLEEKNVVNIGVKNSKGENTGVVIKFDLQDVELPLKMNKMEAMHKKNISVLAQKAVAIDKQEDKKGKFLLSWKIEQKLELLKEFYKREMDALDLFIGEGTTKKILKAINRKPYYNMFDDIIDAISPYFDKLDIEADNLIKNIEAKYNINIDEITI